MENQPAAESKEAFDFRKYQNGWMKKNLREFRLKMNVHGDADVIAKLESEPNIQAYLKQLIRDDIARHAQEETPHHEKV